MNTNPNPNVAFADLFNHVGLQLDSRLKAELANLTGLHNVDFAAISQNVADLMTATDGDDTQSGFQILESIRSDLNAVIAKATGNASSIAALGQTVSDLSTALYSYIDTKVQALETAISDLSTRVAANATAVQTETQRSITKENALEERIATSETNVSNLSSGLQAEVSARQSEKTTIDAAIATNATAVQTVAAEKLDAQWATSFIASTVQLKASFDAGLSGNTYTVV